jgi:hypothetical protein
MRRSWRILLLLLVMLVVAGVTWGERVWVRGERALDIAIYPVAMDTPSAEYVRKLSVDDYREIATFIATEARRWRKVETPAPVIRVMAVIGELPPQPHSRSGWEAIKYSLQLRWYAYRHTPFWRSFGTVRLFVLYHQVRYNKALPHSLGLEKGMIGVAHVFASDEQRAQNNVVLTHELLHTLGARDKYGADGLPVHPEGFADFVAAQRYPQQKAEIMAGRIPLSEGEARIPTGLAETVIGFKTASEIGW